MTTPSTPRPDPRPAFRDDYAGFAPSSRDQSVYGQPGYGQVGYGAEPTAQTHLGQRTGEDPGKVLGIISLVATLSTFVGFNFLGPAVGIVTGHLARRNSRAAGCGDNEMGKWGFILGLVFIGIAIVGAFVGLSVSAVAAVLGSL